jgi:5-methylcytosine-specific restriction enzyme subunit McrC
MSTTVGRLGGVPAAGFVVDMARVYEDFITTALRESLSRYPGGTVGQYRIQLDEPDGVSPPLLMYPDVVHVVGAVPTIVLDAKYKAADPGGRYANADHYQMFAYCTALRLPVGWLAYAGRGARCFRRIVNTDVTVVEYPVDISAPPYAVLRRINDFADEAWIRRNV